MNVSLHVALCFLYCYDIKMYEKVIVEVLVHAVQ